ncbi:hypothetical protein OJ594_11665, partial [Streptococcus anginosus]|nr:hypothetical protein [Streptococcus anginosus]
GFRIVMWVIITTLSCGFTMIYAKRIRKSPQLSASYESDAYFRTDLAKQEDVSHEFTLGHKLILLEMLLGLVWIVWGVMSQGFSIPELASQFF